jgi:2-dehydropantoate 2-reductase
MARVRGLFESAGLKVEIEPNMLHWLWTHFATEAALIGAAISAGSVDALLDDTTRLEAAILAGREALDICRLRGVDVERIRDAATFFAPADAVAIGIHDFYTTNLPARRILERHTGAEELKRIYADVVATGAQLGVATPRLTELGPAVAAWTGESISGLAARSIRQPATTGA